MGIVIKHSLYGIYGETSLLARKTYSKASNPRPVYAQAEVREEQRSKSIGWGGKRKEEGEEAAS